MSIKSLGFTLVLASTLGIGGAVQAADAHADHGKAAAEHRAWSKQHQAWQKDHERARAALASL